MTEPEKTADGLEPGPMDTLPWPQRLRAHVVTPGSDPRIHGYSVEEDLALHYSLVETTLLALLGELPDARQARAAEVALTFLAPAPVAEAPAHAAVLARLCGAADSAQVGVGAVTLAEQARATVEAHKAFLAWLETAAGEPPRECLAGDAAERAAVARLRAALAETGLEIPALGLDIGRTPAILAVLAACGLRRRQHFVAVMVMARLPCVVAEALAVKPTDFAGYPMDLPHFEYEEGP